MSNYHSDYRMAAKPYSGIPMDRNLPFVPRYRYPVKRYRLLSKRQQVRSKQNVSSKYRILVS